MPAGTVFYDRNGNNEELRHNALKKEDQERIHEKKMPGLWR